MGNAVTPRRWRRSVSSRSEPFVICLYLSLP